MPKFDLNNRYGFRFFNGIAAGVVLGVACIFLLLLFILFICMLIHSGSPRRSLLVTKQITTFSLLLNFQSKITYKDLVRS